MSIWSGESFTGILARTTAATGDGAAAPGPVGCSHAEISTAPFRRRAAQSSGTSIRRRAGTPLSLHSSERPRARFSSPARADASSAPEASGRVRAAAARRASVIATASMWKHVTPCCPAGHWQRFTIRGAADAENPWRRDCTRKEVSIECPPAFTVPEARPVPEFHDARETPPESAVRIADSNAAVSPQERIESREQGKGVDVGMFFGAAFYATARRPVNPPARPGDEIVRAPSRRLQGLESPARQAAFGRLADLW